MNENPAPPSSDKEPPKNGDEIATLIAQQSALIASMADLNKQRREMMQRASDELWRMREREEAGLRWTAAIATGGTALLISQWAAVSLLVPSFCLKLTLVCWMASIVVIVVGYRKSLDTTLHVEMWMMMLDHGDDPHETMKSDEWKARSAHARRGLLKFQNCHQLSLRLLVIGLLIAGISLLLFAK